MKSIINDIQKLLFFQFEKQDIENFSRQHFAAAVIGAWLAGMGRYWDSPTAHFAQKLGVGSVVYIFVLGLFIWLLVLPFRLKGWTYFRVVTFIGLTAFPAIIYAFPIEKLTNMDTAIRVNGWFLAIVAAWRLSLLARFLHKFTQLNPIITATLTLLPMALIVSSLAALNLERVVFDIMGGFMRKSSGDDAYLILLVLTYISSIFTPFLFFFYLVGIFMQWRKRKKSKVKQP